MQRQLITMINGCLKLVLRLGLLILAKQLFTYAWLLYDLCVPKTWQFHLREMRSGKLTLCSFIYQTKSNFHITAKGIGIVASSNVIT